MRPFALNIYQHVPGLPDWCNGETITAIFNKERVATLNTSTSTRPASPMSVGSKGEVK